MVTREEIEKICKEAFEEASMGLSIPEISPEKNIAQDLDIDSIHVLETMIIIEDNLDVMLDAEEFQKATTIGDLYDLIEFKIKQKSKIDKFLEEAGDDEFAQSRAIDQLKEHKEKETGPYSKD
tara:strand:+ start:263 stop:631 length:369 start_codon:yes stop_codon:yes gene_type:complete